MGRGCVIHFFGGVRDEDNEEPVEKYEDSADSSGKTQVATDANLNSN